MPWLAGYSLFMRIVCIFLMILVTPLAAQVPELRKAFAPAGDRDGVMKQRKAALANIANVDSASLAKALLKAHLAVERELEPRLGKRRAFIEREVRNARQETRKDIDPLRNLRAEIEKHIHRLGDPAALRLLVDRALNDRSLAMTLRCALAAKAGAVGRDAMDTIRIGLRRRHASSLLVAFIAAKALGRSAERFAPAILARLDDEDAAIREAAASALARLGSPDAIPPMIDRLKQEKGATRDRLAASLEAMCGVKLGSSVKAWKRWLEDNHDQLADLPYGTAARRDPKARQRNPKASSYHGLPLSGESIVFVIDISKSMQQPMKKGGKKGEGETRWVRARTELIAAIDGLPPRKRFGIVAFAGRIRRLSDKLIPATPGNKKRARQFIDKLTFEFGTNIHDALESAFALAGREHRDRYYDTRVDTLFLLTDGRPIVGSGKGDSKPLIRKMTERWNLLGRVTVHVIGLGDQLPAQFLRRLARDQDGEFVHEKSK